MDFSKCICEQSGFCSLFKKNMESNPPNWQWCQNSTEKERANYYSSINNRKKHNTLSDIIKNQNLVHKIDFCHQGEIITTNQLLDDTMVLLIPKILAKHKIAGILGIPRSGMIPSSIISAYLSVPLYSLESNTIVKLNSFSSNGGRRMSNHTDNTGELIIVDDTVYGGGAAMAIKSKFPQYILAATYVSPEYKHLVDYYAREIPAPHFLEWNLFNSGYLPDSAVDIDGIFCPNVPLDICKDDKKYADYLVNVIPFFKRIAKLFPIKALVTARLEKYRNITEEWLDKYGIKYQQLIMLPTNLETEKAKNHLQIVSKFKAEVAQSINAKFFIESEIEEAKAIKQHHPSITMVCPNHGIFF